MMPEMEYDDDGWPRMQWFGESWGAPVCEYAQHAQTPVGSSCAQLCGDSITENDQGFLIPLLGLDGPPEYLAHHIQCWRESVIPNQFY